MRAAVSVHSVTFQSGARAATPTLRLSSSTLVCMCSRSSFVTAAEWEQERRPRRRPAIADRDRDYAGQEVPDAHVRSEERDPQARDCGADATAVDGVPDP